jgi:hypothetical protein
MHLENPLESSSEAIASYSQIFLSSYLYEAHAFSRTLAQRGVHQAGRRRSPFIAAHAHYGNSLRKRATE